MHQQRPLLKKCTPIHILSAQTKCPVILRAVLVKKNPTAVSNRRRDITVAKAVAFSYFLKINDVTGKYEYINAKYVFYLTMRPE